MFVNSLFKDITVATRSQVRYNAACNSPIVEPDLHARGQ